MKKLLALILIAFVTLGLVACAGNQGQDMAIKEQTQVQTQGQTQGQTEPVTSEAATTAEETAPEPVLEAYASIYPLYYFATRIGQERVSVALIVPPGTDAHDFEPAAKLVGQLTQTDLILYNGLGLEHWTDQLFAQLPETVTRVFSSEGISTHTIEEALGGDHDHEHEEGEEGHHHTGVDPHVWLDPVNALIQAENILKAFIAKDAEGEAYYRTNFEALKGELEALHTTFNEGLEGYSRREIVVGHAAFAYLTERYNLKMLAISGISPLEEPSAAALGELSHLVKDHGVTTIFYETLASPKFSEVLAAETGTITAVLNPLEGLTQEEMDAGETYFTLMRANFEAIKKSLE